MNVPELAPKTIDLKVKDLSIKGSAHLHCTVTKVSLAARITYSLINAHHQKGIPKKLLFNSCAYNNQADREICNSHVLFISHTYTQKTALR
jgi:hypothetical protein